jgi:hypothetical protein
MTYEFPCPDVVGNWPGMSVAIMPFSSLNAIVVTPTYCSQLLTCRGGSNVGSRSSSSFMISFTVGLVGLIPFLIMCMCPIAVDIYFGRCFLIALLVNQGKDVNQSLSMSLQSALTGRDPIVALSYAINFAMVGWW